MERRDLYQDDLTEERYPSPASREDASATQPLDPDEGGGDQQASIPRSPSASSAPAPDDDDDDDDDEEEDDEE